MACLRDCGLVPAVPDGRRTRYALADPRLGNALDDLRAAVVAVKGDKTCPAVDAKGICFLVAATTGPPGLGPGPSGRQGQLTDGVSRPAGGHRAAEKSRPRAVRAALGRAQHRRTSRARRSRAFRLSRHRAQGVGRHLSLVGLLFPLCVPQASWLSPLVIGILRGLVSTDLEMRTVRTPLSRVASVLSLSMPPDRLAR